MTPEQTAVQVAVLVALLATTAGQVARSGWRLCWGLGAYVAALVPNSIVLLLLRPFPPDLVWWRATTVVLDAVVLWIALEIAWRVFRTAADNRATSLALGGIAVITTTTRLVMGGRVFVYDPWGPWIANGPLLIMAATLLIARRDRLTLHPFHCAVLASFAVYLAVFDLLPSLYGFEWPPHPFVWTLRRYQAVAFLALVSFWAYAAWRLADRGLPSGRGTLGPENPV